MDGRAGMVEVTGGRVRGIALNLRFIWIGLFIAVVSKYLSTRPRPEVRSLFPPCPSSKSLSSDSLPTIYTNMDGSRDYDLCIRQQPKQARMCGVGGTSFCLFFLFLFSLAYFPFSIFFLCGHGMGSLTLAGSLAADRRPIDPPPIVQLRVIDKARKNLPSPSPSPPPTQHHQQPTPHPHAQQHTHESTGPLDTSMLTPAGFGAGPFLQNPYYFMFASLAKPDDDTELHWMKVCLDYFFYISFEPLIHSHHSLSRMARPDVPRDQLSRHSIT
jgi:hypothetical protein